MNVQALKTMMELQALQGLNSNSKSGQPVSGSDSSLFQQMLTETLASQSMQPQLSKLGSVSQMIPLFSNGNSLVTKNAASYISNAASVSTSKAPDSSIQQIISRAAQKYNLPVKLISSVISQESNFKPDAVSHAGASGLMQLMPATARGLGVTDIFDPEQNVFAGTKYLKQMMDKYNGRLELALAAYNAGPGNVDKYNGIPPFKETMQYVQKVSQRYYT
ncbi:lytic transglycosylase domain-containing protein [Rossellomorea vietnamensis]|uniref:Lytic transglycosylase domain-containing protein n=1 Tax=Rossellomorea vietnamensis TaxID=218284 RepID=A0A5D4NQS8_9BACI|nr:lytic transglycosylase domain-containing protein [Rossellomorea vietnamensis]TYS15818.1 lytic transglycosylase domain-containing protein [Rossellomorea vietnamensis]